ncbi:MAG: hypothetical protein K8T25_23090 [Planctomycetia bacterium]|nr:hypothetical protein [Planctomycetia bacterium]
MNQFLQLPRGARLLAMLAIVNVGLSGCSKVDDQRKQVTLPTTVQVLQKGTPVADCQVILHPIDPDKVTLRPVLPNGKTGPDGTATLTSYMANDGAPPGEYVVTLICKPAAGEKDGETEYAADKFEGRYADVKKSTIHSTVKPGETSPIRIEAE